MSAFTRDPNRSHHLGSILTPFFSVFLVSQLSDWALGLLESHRLPSDHSQSNFVQSTTIADLLFHSPDTNRDTALAIDSDTQTISSLSSTYLPSGSNTISLHELFSTPYELLHSLHETSVNLSLPLREIMAASIASCIHFSERELIMIAHLRWWSVFLEDPLPWGVNLPWEQWHLPKSNIFRHLFIPTNLIEYGQVCLREEECVGLSLLTVEAKLSRWLETDSPLTHDYAAAWHVLFCFCVSLSTNPVLFSCNYRLS